MATRTKSPGEIPAPKAAPKRRRAPGPRTSRKAQPAEADQVRHAEGSEPEVESASIESSPTTEEIAQRAYEIYLRRGSRHGYDFDDWLEAEQELRRGTR